MNFAIQAGSQGITKLAMASAWKSRNRLYSPEDVRFLMQIHDELMLEIKGDEEFVLEIAKWLKGIMDNVVMLSIPMISDVKVGYRWNSMEKLEL